MCKVEIFFNYARLFVKNVNFSQIDRSSTEYLTSKAQQSTLLKKNRQMIHSKQVYLPLKNLKHDFS